MRKRRPQNELAGPLATRTQQSINGKSKAAGRGAGMLAPSTTQGIYHRSLLGLSVPGGPGGVLAHGESQTAAATQQPIACSSTAPEQVVVIPEAAEEDAQDVEGFKPP